MHKKQSTAISLDSLKNGWGNQSHSSSFLMMTGKHGRRQPQAFQSLHTKNKACKCIRVWNVMKFHFSCMTEQKWKLRMHVVSKSSTCSVLSNLCKVQFPSRYPSRILVTFCTAGSWSQTPTLEQKWCTRAVTAKRTLGLPPSDCSRGCTNPKHKQKASVKRGLKEESKGYNTGEEHVHCVGKAIWGIHVQGSPIANVGRDLSLPGDPQKMLLFSPGTRKAHSGDFPGMQEKKTLQINPLPA